jgi:8-oxo-dGTP pyrophosphatase MutT (NUDIX family)
MNFHNFIRDSEGWELIHEELAFSNPHLQVRSTRIKTPSRRDGCAWTVVHRKAGAVVAPITANGDLLLVRQERVPIRASIWEFPAGQIDDSDEHDDNAIRQTALRELREEAGYELAPGGELIPMGYFFTSSGFTDEHTYLFAARPVVPSAHGAAHDANEVITECRAFTPAEFRAMIASNEIRDANTLSSFARLCALGFL